MDHHPWRPHPGCLHRIPPHLAALTDQVAAQRRVEQLVDAEDWRGDKRARWSTMLRRLVCAMDWATGLVCGVTLEHLAAAADTGTRTVSGMLAWARDAELLVVIEGPATAAFLGSQRNRTPTYALVAPRPAEPAGDPAAAADTTQVNGPVDELCDPPTSYVSSKPLPRRGRGLDRTHRTPSADWPTWQIPATPAERTAAAATLLARIGLDGRGAPARRVWGQLHRWWTAGACVAGLLHALDYHPDRPDQRRGDALRSARDPLALLGHRLAPWDGRLGELPAHLHGRAGDYLAEQAARVAAGVAAAGQPATPAPTSTATAREDARAQLAALLARHRPKRRSYPRTARGG